MGPAIAWGTVLMVLIVVATVVVLAPGGTQRKP